MSPVFNEKKYRPNLSEIAYNEIKEMILSGEMAQGERIFLDEMSTKLNISITPIREALNKLAQEDLIKITPRTSHQVISLDAKDSNDIQDLRLLLETFAFQSAGENICHFPVQRFRELFQRPDLIQDYSLNKKASKATRKNMSNTMPNFTEPSSPRV